MYYFGTTSFQRSGSQLLHVVSLLHGVILSKCVSIARWVTFTRCVTFARWVILKQSVTLHNLILLQNVILAWCDFYCELFFITKCNFHTLRLFWTATFNTKGHFCTYSLFRRRHFFPILTHRAKCLKKVTHCVRLTTRAKMSLCYPETDKNFCSYKKLW